jgi:hypothetical protein
MEKQDCDALSVKKKYKAGGICSKCKTFWNFTYSHVVLSMLCPKDDNVVQLFQLIDSEEETS